MTRLAPRAAMALVLAMAFPQLSAAATSATEESATATATTAPTDNRYTGGDGTEAATAIVIADASNGSEGIAAEYAYIATRFPGWRPRMQATVNVNDRVYDRLTLVDKSGATRELWFDITNWYGRL